MNWMDTRVISTAYTSSNVKLGVSQAMYLFQDGFTCCLESMGCDNVTLGKKYNDFWVITKAKVHFDRFPDWNEKITIKTKPLDNKLIRTHLKTSVMDMDGKTCAVCVNEFCPLSKDDHRPVKLSQICYPEEGFDKDDTDTRFEKFIDVSSLSLYSQYEQMVFSEHIDMSKHVNNVEYVKMCMNLFSVEFVNTAKITDIEVHYLGECKEGQKLQVSRYDYDENTSYCHITEGDRHVFEMKVVYDFSKNIDT